MEFDTIESLVGATPFKKRANARFLYDLILEQKVERILELGIAHGTATCYMAAAIDKAGAGSITAVDLISELAPFAPSAEEQLQATGLSKYVTIHRMETGYTWFLHDEIKKSTVDHLCSEKYDLCVIDGPKNWTIDGAAFFLADKVLKKNGWLIFDDYLWTYAGADKMRATTDGITHRELSKPERETPQVREIFELLVRQHPNYSNFTIWGDEWAIAQKTSSDVKTYTFRYDESYKDVFGKLFC